MSASQDYLHLWPSQAKVDNLMKRTDTSLPPWGRVSELQREQRSGVRSQRGDINALCIYTSSLHAGVRLRL